MSSLPTLQAMMWNGDDPTTSRQTTVFSFPNSAFLMSRSSNLSNLSAAPGHKSLSQHPFMNDALFPVFLGMRTGMNGRSHSFNQNGYWSVGSTDRALHQMDVTVTSIDDPLEGFASQHDEVQSSSQVNQGLQQRKPQELLLQDQQKKLRERMEYLSSLLNSSKNESHSETLKRSLELTDTPIKEEPSYDDFPFPDIEQPPAAKRQRVVPSPKSNDKRFRTYQAEQWNEKFDDLVRFKIKYGHCCVPHTYSEDTTLVRQSQVRWCQELCNFCMFLITLSKFMSIQARWVKRQRYQYKLFMEGTSGSTMTEERKSLLAELGFVWDRHSEAWEIRYAELLKFLQEHGHTNVPSNYENAQLATWIKCQRRQYKMRWEAGAENKKTLLCDERIQRLEALGFEWELRSRSKATDQILASQ